MKQGLITWSQNGSKALRVACWCKRDSMKFNQQGNHQGKRGRYISDRTCPLYRHYCIRTFQYQLFRIWIFLYENVDSQPRLNSLAPALTSPKATHHYQATHHYPGWTNPVLFSSGPDHLRGNTSYLWQANSLCWYFQAVIVHLILTSLYGST